MKLTILKLTLFIFPITVFSQDTIKLFYLGGQSNMDGFGYNKDLPNSLRTFENVWIFHGNPAADGEKGGLGIWEKLQPGHGTGFSSDHIKNRLSNRFGMELSFAKKLRELYPYDKIAIIKYSRGGTSIDSIAPNNGCWEPDYRNKKGINQYDHFLSTLNNAFKKSDIDKNGQKDILIPSGIIWMQGESDATKESVAKRYYKNLKRLMDLLRAAFRVDDLPIVIGKISDSHANTKGKVWKYCELVQYAQEKFVEKDENAMIVRNTKYYKYSDAAHYNSQGYIDLGKRCAEALHKLTHHKSK